MAAAAVERVATLAVGVEADNGEPGLRVRDCQRQPDIAEPHDADDERSGGDTLIELALIHWRHPLAVLHHSNVRRRPSASGTSGSHPSSVRALVMSGSLRTGSSNRSPNSDA